MKRLYSLCAIIMPFAAFADGYERPIPQAQSATAEIWFAFASLALIAALVVVARLVSRR